jgi:hypothetical protein
MKTVKLAIIIFVIFLLFGCDNNLSSTDSTPGTTTPGTTTPGTTTPEIDDDSWLDTIDYGPAILYYGAHLEYFPPKVRDWIINTQFTKERMERPSMLNPALKVYWSEDNNTVLFEASYTVAPGYVEAGTVKTWGQNAYYSGSSSIFDTYGEYAKYQTLRFKYQLKLDVERLLREDPIYAEVIEFAKRLCDELEYDWSNFSGYDGPVKPTPDKKQVVCDGYANEVSSRMFELSCVKAVQRWTAPEHAWNVLKLVDGRTLYLDLTWFDNERINKETGEIYQTDDYDWENITFHSNLFRFSNVGYGTKVFEHDIGKLDKEITR